MKGPRGNPRAFFFVHSFRVQSSRWNVAIDARPALQLAGRVLRLVTAAALAGDPHQQQDDRFSGVEAAGAVAGIMAFAAILSIGLPGALLHLPPTRAGWVAAVFFLLLRLASVPQRVIRATMLILAFVLAALPVANVWRDGRGGLYSIGGALPWSDASNYYSGAVSLLESKKLDGLNEWRPLNTAINSVKLRVGGSVRGWVVMSAFLMAIGLAIFAREIALLLAPAASAAVVGTIVGHGAEYWATTMTETNGLLFALFGTAMFLLSIRRRRVRWYWCGCFLIALALDARAGAFFVLPFLWVWGFVTFAGSVRRRIGISFAAVLITLGAFLPARLYESLWGTGHRGAHANFAWTLYGIAAGNRGWVRVFRDYPQLVNSPDQRQQTQFVYDRAFELIRAHPRRFAQSLVHSIEIFLEDAGAFFFNLDARITVLALLLCLLRWRDPLSSFVLFVFVGNALSAPFLIWDASPRLFVATLPAAALTVAIAVAFAERIAVRLTAPHEAIPVAPPTTDDRPAAVALALVAILLVMPLILPATRARASLPPPPIEARGSNVVMIRGSSGEWVDVLQPNQPILDDISRTALSDVARTLRPPFSFGLAAVRREPSEAWFATRSGLLLPATRAPLLLAGVDRTTTNKFHYLLVSDVYLLSGDGKHWSRAGSR